MPKVGMEPIRREALVEATIEEIGRRGNLDVTVSQIAKRAGMSSALAHHYFGGKEQIFLAAMRHILKEFGAEVRLGLSAAISPKDRLNALIDASFAPSCFDPATTTAWMTFYSQAQTVPEAGRMLRIYQSRLRSNLVHALRPISESAEADSDALAALIDGLYIRAVLNRVEPEEAIQTVRRVCNSMIGEY